MSTLFLVSKRIIDLHGGRIGVTSPGEGLGSTFFFEVPVVAKSAPTAPRDGDGPQVGAVSALGLSRWAERSTTAPPLSRMDSMDHRGSLKIFPSHDDKRTGDMAGDMDIQGISRANSGLFNQVNNRQYASSNNIPNCNSSSAPKISSLNGSTTGNAALAHVGGLALSGPLSVLIVDDASSNRKMVRRVLDKQMFTVEEAEDGLVAVAKVTQRMERNESPYDVILMDFMMPNMDGPTATSAIRGMGYNGIIIGVTGNHLPQDVLRLTLSGTNAIISKPLDIDRLVSTISSKEHQVSNEVAFCRTGVHILFETFISFMFRLDSTLRGVASAMCQIPPRPPSTATATRILRVEIRLL